MGHTVYSKEEIVRRGRELYEERIRPYIEADHRGKIMVLDIETGDYVIDEDELTASELAYRKRPGAPLFALKIGSPTMGRIGGSSTLQRP